MPLVSPQCFLFWLSEGRIAKSPEGQDRTADSPMNSPTRLLGRSRRYSGPCFSLHDLGIVITLLLQLHKSETQRSAGTAVRLQHCSR